MRQDLEKIIENVYWRILDNGYGYKGAAVQTYRLLIATVYSLDSPASFKRCMYQGMHVHHAHPLCSDLSVILYQ